MKLWKKIQAFMVAGLMIVNLGCVQAAQAKAITVEIDGQPVCFDVQPQILDGRTMVPLRAIFEEIGALIKWDGETKTVTARKGSKTVTLSIDSAEMQIDKGKTDADGNPIVETVTLDVPAQLVSDRTLVPLRAISEAFGLTVNWDGDAAKVSIDSDNEKDDSWKENVGEIDLDTLTYAGEGVTVDGKEIVITKGGDFTVRGTLDGGRILVRAEEKVKLRLNGAIISTSGAPCIFFEKADKAYITLSKGSENTLTCTNCESGAIYAKDDLEIKGSGSLTLFSDAGHGIKASDDLKIEAGRITIDAARDGVHVNDTFKMTGGELSVTAKNDGIASESIVMISGGILNVQTTLEPTGAAQTTATAGGFGKSADVEFSASAKGIKADWMLVVSGGEITVNSTDHAVHCADEIEISGGVFHLASTYAKGISGHGNVTVDGESAEIHVTKSTEGIESKNVLTINNGLIRIVASDDALNGTGGNSDDNMGGGFIRPMTGTQPPTVPQQPTVDAQSGATPMPPAEGQMPPTAEAQPGDVQPQMRPDKGNADGTRGGMQGGFGRNFKDSVIINGGDIEVTAGDDCIDANGNIVINGGFIKATSLNGGIVHVTGVFDPDGTTTISEGATVIAVALSGGSGVQNRQNAILLYPESTHAAGDAVRVLAADGSLIGEYTPTGSYAAVYISAPELQPGKTCTVTVGAESKEIPVTSSLTTVGTAQNSGMGGMGGKGNFGGDRTNRGTWQPQDLRPIEP